MADLTATFLGVKSPNPFWLASAPPTNSGDQVMRAFEAGWGGAVWKTLGKQIQNVSSRFGAVDYAGRKIIGFNNIELISDRPLEVNLREMAECKKRFPKHALIASLMVETREEWREIIRQVEDVGSDALELNFGCPHGMCERGMGSAVGQEPLVIKEITSWAKEFARVPVIVKLTPNITDITVAAAAAREGGADAVSLINTIKSIVGVDIDQFVPYPIVGNKGTNGGYCGPAVKPIALHMLGAIARKNGPALPISGIGGVSNWRDAVEFMLLGASNVQVCTAVMHYGYRIIEDMTQGLSDYMNEKGFRSVSELVGKAIPNYTNWEELDRSYRQIAKIHEQHCIGCNLCVVACDDGAHQCIKVNPELREDGHTRRAPIIDEPECVGCNLCSLVCPAPGAITMVKTTTPGAPIH
jgi:dihydropyrimidine dehydrogenase (NAD+) subunit PreA